MNYLLHIPKEYEKNKNWKWPMIVFLHGLAERGNNLQKIIRVGLPKQVQSMTGFPFIVLSPQCPFRTYWDRENQAIALKEIIDSVIRNYQIDESRLYLTGYSMGGYGTWYTAAFYPDIFAAIAPICGGGNPTMMNKLSYMPTWVFHAENDTVVSIKKAHRMIDALIKAGNKSVTYTFYSSLGHHCWAETYSNMELYKWFLKYNKENKMNADADTLASQKQIIDMDVEQ
jgi:predicted peptidase